MRYFITGCAGFIGSNLTDRLLQEGHNVVGYDNLSTGKQSFIENALAKKCFTFIQGDLLNLDTLCQAMSDCDAVFHLAANADVRLGLQHPRKDLELNTIATFNVLEAMRINRIQKIIFTSTGSIYGKAPLIPTPENCPFPVQTSLYGCSKLAAEGLIQAYCEGFGFQSYIFRLVSILGERYTHGHIVDFYQQLKHDPSILHILGNGQQKKSYLYIQDCIDGMLHALNHAHQQINIFNLGTNEYCQVNDSVAWICDYLKVAPALKYTGGEQGWIGDNPFIFLDCNKIRSLGWEPKLSIHDSVIKTVHYLKGS